MSITEIVKNSLNYPFSDLKKLLSFSGLLLIISIISSLLAWGTLWSFQLSNGYLSYLNSIMVAIEIIIPILLSFFTLGYIYRIVENGINKNKTIPDFNKWKKMFVDGAKLFILNLGYAIVPIILSIIGAFLVFDISFSSTTIINSVMINPNDTLVTLGLFFYTIAAIIYIALLFFQIMAVNYMINCGGNLSYGFKFRDILDKIKGISYGKFISAVLFAVLISFIILFAFTFATSFISMVFMFIPIIGHLISFCFAIIVMIIVEAYIYLFFARTCGLLYNE